MWTGRSSASSDRSVRCAAIHRQPKSERLTVGMVRNQQTGLNFQVVRFASCRLLASLEMELVTSSARVSANRELAENVGNKQDARRCDQ